jgi:hypothetical protein
MIEESIMRGEMLLDAEIRQGQAGYCRYWAGHNHPDYPCPCWDFQAALDNVEWGKAQQAAETAAWFATPPADWP